jgi:hypothetical protein
MFCKDKAMCEEPNQKQPKVKNESSDIQEKEASVKIAGPKTGKDKPGKTPAREQ